jgi:hypothetical protein
MSYNPPKLLQKVQFAQNQKVFWGDLNRWFAALDAGDSGQVQSAVSPKLNSELISAQVSRNRAFLKIHSSQLGTDTTDFPTGMGLEPVSVPGDKEQALSFVKQFGRVDDDFTQMVIQRASAANDTKFFSQLYRALEAHGCKNDYRGFIGNKPKLPRKKNDKSEWLAEMMVSFWCGTQWWPYWADRNLPPFCILTDGAIAELLNNAFAPEASAKPQPHEITDLTSEDAVQKCRKRYGLLAVKAHKQIISVINTNGKLYFKTGDT